MHCSVLATDGLKVAIDDYLKRQGRDPIGGEILSENPDFDPHADEEETAAAADACHLHE
jgi:hypothetical protein